MRFAPSLLALVTAASCGGGDAGSEDTPDAAPDAFATPDASSDAASDELFVVSGDCDVLDTELLDDAPSAFDNVVAFDHSFTESDEADLSMGGQKLLDDGNAGGGSLFSEIFAFEILHACEAALLLKSENEIGYAPGSVKTDFLAEIDGTKIGVSVTRAQTFPLGGDFTEQNATDLLGDKLTDILESSANVAPEDAWEKQILAVLVYNRDHLASLESALTQIAEPIRSDTVVWLSVTDGPDDFIYE